MPKAMAETTPLSDTSHFGGVSPTSRQKRQDEVDEGPPPVIADDAADVLSPNLPYSLAADSREASRSRALATMDFDGAFQFCVAFFF